MKVKRIIQLAGMLFSFACTTFAAEGTSSDIRTYIIPASQAGIHSGTLLLNGTWDFRYSEKSSWDKIKVPGEAVMQGYAIRHDQPFFYRKKFTLPKEFANKKIILRFDGVYSHAKLFVNGQYVREHHGGFTRWETDVTPFVRPGKSNEIQLEVEDRLDEVSYASGYAHHPIGGILRDVTLFALPQAFIYDFHTETDLDSHYRDATLRVLFQSEEEMEAVYTLMTPDGKEYPLTQTKYTVKSGTNQHDLSVSAPLKWDAEHPNLYRLSVCLLKGETEVGRFTREIGFREVEIKGDQMLVNGMPVKLRGACRHDIHPTLGRTTTAELDSLDVLLFKRANMNFVRTSHYPPSEAFLKYCDRMGIYVECETAACFVDTYRQKNYAPGRTQDSTLFTPRYMGQLQEMVKSHRSHASVLFWSIGNESVYGKNFQASWDWVKATDKTRPVIFSYPGSVGDREPIYDILSMHYQDYNGNLSQWNRTVRGFQGEGIPALFDEWAHPACYTYETLQHDPGIREFWGHSIEKMWSGLFDARGGLGGAIWGYVDEIFQIPKPKVGDAFWKEFAHTAKPEGFRGECVGYGEWGIVDVWRREKPEFWATKKAYSPVRLLETSIPDMGVGERLLLPVYNRFDHTNLREIQVRYIYNDIEKEAVMPAVSPHHKGLLVIPAEDWKAGTAVDIHFYTSKGELIDSERVALGEQQVQMPARRDASVPLTVEETSEQIIVRGNRFEIPFSKETGLIERATSDGQVFIEKGPFLNLFINLNHLSGAEVRKMADRIITSETDWKKSSLNYTQKEGRVEVSLVGTYQDIQLDMEFLITPDGRLAINYKTEGEPNGYLRETGIAFHLSDAIDHLKWKRRGMWSCYPADAMAGNEGDAPLFQSQQAAYGQRPTQPWADDTRNYYYWADAGANCSRPLTQRAKSMKEHIYYYTLTATGHAGALSVCSPAATLACRMDTRSDGQVILYINDRWDYPEIAWGNYCQTLEASPCAGRMEIQLH